MKRSTKLTAALVAVAVVVGLKLIGPAVLVNVPVIRALASLTTHGALAGAVAK